MKSNTKESFKIPHHIAIILDGNRRWARARGFSIYRGHLAGMNNLMKITDAAAKRGIKILTVYAFSTENQKRCEKEKKDLFRIFKYFMIRYRTNLRKNGVRVKILGDILYFPADLQKEILKTVNFLRNGKKFQFNIALNYGGRNEIIQAVRKIVKLGIKSENIAEDLISKNLYTAGDKDPDMIIRPGGEQRLSNFLIWQASYSELYFCEKYWPEFDEKELDKAICEYDRRERRFGR